MSEAYPKTVDAAEAIESALCNLRSEKNPVLVAIDGQCGSGKTTLAFYLQQRLSCSLIRMDDFYLRPGQRTKERLARPGGNVDYERFLTEVLLPLRDGDDFSYRPFDCKSMTFSDPVHVAPASVALVEGSYSCHPSLYSYYDLHVFLTVDPIEQMHRIVRRDGEEKAKQFQSLWIPLEELYFSEIPVKERCELCFDMTTEPTDE